MSSRFLIWWLMAVCVRLSSIAARVKLKCRAAASNARKLVIDGQLFLMAPNSFARRIAQYLPDQYREIHDGIRISHLAGGGHEESLCRARPTGIQHQCDDHHDRRKGLRHDPGRPRAQSLFRFDGIETRL